MTDRHKIVSAGYLILKKDGKLLLLRRKNTGYHDGDYTVVSGHGEAGESLMSAMVREAKEEAGITVKPEDLKLVHVVSRRSEDERVDLFWDCLAWTGEPTNMEPEKCDDLRWFDLDELPENMLPVVKQGMDQIERGIMYSEYNW